MKAFIQLPPRHPYPHPHQLPPPLTPSVPSPALPTTTTAPIPTPAPAPHQLSPPHPSPTVLARPLRSSDQEQPPPSASTLLSSTELSLSTQTSVHTVTSIPTDSKSHANNTTQYIFTFKTQKIYSASWQSSLLRCSSWSSPPLLTGPSSFLRPRLPRPRSRSF